MTSENTELSHPGRNDLRLTDVLFALSDPERLAIVRQLAGGPLEMAQCHLSDPSIPKSTKSHLMKVLREAGIIRNEPFGRGRRLSLRYHDLEARFPGLIASVLSACGVESDAGQPGSPAGKP
ncbi:helix-turn-helix domain-containing protein [Shinella curvata]|uniref:Helix-turn-helix domain-containing protein n=1 Tax=Shinella curvata TaxID=1817964 RepID=A0ABT8XIM8_9HYPH|nr:helix-turn-helix domain-containing protein [Shinella curvata]MCJ8055842.1 helix-turn-helix domain-containing protein [Shinella curvata]MDO6123557.1 helix-turn-helix domain-containing protein [Shinella curvata]